MQFVSFADVFITVCTNWNAIFPKFLKRF